MELKASFTLIDATTRIAVEITREAQVAALWEEPHCKVRLLQLHASLDVGHLSLAELLSLLHLPLRRDQWPQIVEEQIGDCELSLVVGSFDHDQGPPHQMILRSLEVAGAEMCIAFSERQAEQWAVAIWEINRRLQVFR